MLVSGIQQSDSVIHLYVYTCTFLFNILFHYRLLQDNECSSLGYTVGPCWLSTIYMVVCIFWRSFSKVHIWSCYFSPWILYCLSVALRMKFNIFMYQTNSSIVWPLLTSKIHLSQSGVHIHWSMSHRVFHLMAFSWEHLFPSRIALNLPSVVKRSDSSSGRYLSVLQNCGYPSWVFW